LYNYYYGGGDTFDYWRAGLNIKSAIFTEPEIGLKLLFIDTKEDAPAEAIKYIHWTNYIFRETASTRVAQIGTILSFITANSYLSTGMLLGFFSFLGCWKICEVFYELYPHLHKKIAIATLFIPSVFFWGSAGLLKDFIIYLLKERNSLKLLFI